ncbi:PD-(D/E)XK nuclease family protein [Hymenobacter fodinae]|uniref:PD-(D/E)XK nuclease superfamily protein n=1 Tax=Hymenobacter fodinae TaxID=2510796 RepID=A0A4Z0P710_9BACT|nr:PD-(D/E)XK nuclease family protein [Hymenobacter fodinae]TGE06438.1 hypothetical protein EU556_16485 [Hymenobacter fodinae]
MKPNIFSLATKELSQDSFFAWLLQWGNTDCQQYDGPLHEAAQHFIRLLLQCPADYEIKQVEAGRQWQGIDVWAEVNGEYFIAIEDKTNTGEHSEQLERYHKIATEHYKDTSFKLVFIYLKTGNESITTLNEINTKGYTIVSRKLVVDVLAAHQVENDIFNDFKEYLSNIELQSNSYLTFSNITDDWKAAEGFFVRLQELVGEWSDWRYVPNQTGGFLGFWYHWQGTEEFDLYIQIENGFANGIKVVVKIGDWTPSVDTLYTVLNGLQPYAKAQGLTLHKPQKYRAGPTSTLAVLKNPFLVNEADELDIGAFLATLKALQLVLDEYSTAERAKAQQSILVEDPDAVPTAIQPE